MHRTAHGTAVLTPQVVTPGGSRDDDSQLVRIARQAWLAGYSPETAANYGWSIDRWFDYLAAAGVHPFQAQRSMLELYGKELTRQGRMDSTVAKRMGHAKSFYRFCAIEGFIERDPVGHARVPKVDDDVMRPYLDRLEISRILAAAEALPAALRDRDRALVTFLAFTGLRISAALSANIETLSEERGHHTIVVRSKNRKIVSVPLVPRVRRAIYMYIGERTEGPLFLGLEGRRLNRCVAYKRIGRLAKLAGIEKKIGNHSFRRSFITNSLDAGVPMRDVQHSVHHKDPRTTARYDQNRRSLDTHAGYALSAFIPGS